MTRVPVFTTVVAQTALVAQVFRPAVAILAVLALAVPTGALGQTTRHRGAAPVDGRAVPRADVAQAPTEGRAPQPEAPRAVPRVVMPQVVVPKAIQPQGEIGRPGDHPAYWPDYRPDHRPDYRPDYRPHDQPNHRPRHRPEYRPYYRPHYTFLPRVRLGFGLWVGYPVTYPLYFHPYVSYPYAYRYPYPNTSPYPTSSYPVPGTAGVGAAGGLSFEIRPPEAGVYVDGQYVGMVGQFSPNQPPLALAPGRHHVEIREPGFEIIAFDVDILPGQVIPYQGDLGRF